MKLPFFDQKELCSKCGSLKFVHNQTSECVDCFERTKKELQEEFEEEEFNELSGNAKY